MRVGAPFLDSVNHVPMLSQEQFDAIEFDAASSGDHGAAARMMSGLAETAAETAGMTRAEAFLRAGEQWLLADSPSQAAESFERAMVDGGPVSADPRVPLARALFQLGRQADAQALVGQLRAERPADPRTCDLLAELLVEQSELPAALDIATAGVELCLAAASQPGDSQTAGTERELNLLLRLRYRIRNDLGLPEDDYDALLDES